MADKLYEEIQSTVKALELPVEILEGFEVQKLVTSSHNTLLETYEKVVAGQKLQDCMIVIVAPLKFGGRFFPLIARCYCDPKGKFQVIKAMLLDDITIYPKETQQLQKESKLSHQMDFLLATTSGVLANLIASLLEHIVMYHWMASANPVP